MSHLVESGVYANEAPWMGLSKRRILHDEKTEGKLYPAQALTKGDLDWLVTKEPQVRGGEILSGMFWTVRSSDDRVLGSVGSQYQPVQNHEGFQLLSDLVDNDEIEIETALSLKGGRLVTILCRRPDDILIAGEKILDYLSFANSHDGSGGVALYATPIREVCWNTHSYSIKHAPRIHRVRHTRNVADRLAEARKSLELSFEYTNELAKRGEWMAEYSISDREFDDFLTTLLPPPPEPEKAKRAATIREHRREAIRDVYFDSDNLNNIRRTRWGALNAVVQWSDHQKPRRSDEARYTATMLGDDLNQRAFEILGPSGAGTVQ